MRLDGRLDKLEARLPRCRQVREFVAYREGEPEPGPFPPCAVCGDRDCGVIVICEQVIVGREADGTLVTEAGTRIPPGTNYVGGKS